MAVLLFPGQGSQAPNMGRYLFDNFDIAKKTYQEANDSLNFDIQKLCFDGPESELALTENTQPALLCTSIATFRVLQKMYDLKIEAAAGHSIGEYAALVAAGVISFADGMRAVRVRGQAMQSAVPVGQGGMTAVLGLEPNQVKWLCEWAEKESGFTPISAANFNSPGQIVISGSKLGLDWLKDNIKTELIPENLGPTPKKAKLIPLNVSAPFHCSMMNPAQEKMSQVLGEVNFSSSSQFPIIQNVNAKIITDTNEMRKNLIQQVSAPVLWTQTMQTMLENSWFNGIECGHGQVLKGLFKKMDAEKFNIQSTNNLDDIKAIKL